MFIVLLLAKNMGMSVWVNVCKCPQYIELGSVGLLSRNADHHPYGSTRLKRKFNSKGLFGKFLENCFTMIRSTIYQFSSVTNNTILEYHVLLRQLIHVGRNY